MDEMDKDVLRLSLAMEIGDEGEMQRLWMKVESKYGHVIARVIWRRAEARLEPKDASFYADLNKL